MFWHLIFQSWKWMREKYGWRIKKKKKKEEFRVFSCEKLTLNAKRVTSVAHFSPSPLNFSTRQQNLWHTGGCAPSYCEELHLQKHSQLDSWIFIRWLGALIYQAVTEKGWWVFRSWGTHRQKYDSVNADPTLHIIGCLLEKRCWLNRKTPPSILWFLVHWSSNVGAV